MYWIKCDKSDRRDVRCVKDWDEEIMRKVEKSFVFEAGGKSDATLTVPFEFLPRDE